MDFDLLVELAAAAVMMDKEHQDLPQDLTYAKSYSFGRIEEYNIVLACLSAGQGVLALCSSCGPDKVNISFDSI